MPHQSPGHNKFLEPVSAFGLFFPRLHCQRNEFTFYMQSINSPFKLKKNGFQNGNGQRNLRDCLFPHAALRTQHVLPLVAGAGPGCTFCLWLHVLLLDVSPLFSRPARTRRADGVTTHKLRRSPFVRERFYPAPSVK